MNDRAPNQENAPKTIKIRIPCTTKVFYCLDPEIIMNGYRRAGQVDESGELMFLISGPGGFLWLRYERATDELK